MSKVWKFEMNNISIFIDYEVFSDGGIEVI